MSIEGGKWIYTEFFRNNHVVISTEKIVCETCSGAETGCPILSFEADLAKAIEVAQATGKSIENVKGMSEKNGLVFSSSALLYETGGEEFAYLCPNGKGRVIFTHNAP